MSRRSSRRRRRRRHRHRRRELCRVTLDCNKTKLGSCVNILSFFSLFTLSYNHFDVSRLRSLTIFSNIVETFIVSVILLH